jgi:predicted GNAT family acetyltransferase
VVFRGLPSNPPESWQRLDGGNGHQMVLRAPLSERATPPPVDPETGAPVEVRALGEADVDAMVELVALTEPGPFRRRTVELGGYVGVFHGDALVAMAGQRFAPPGHREVSAVCTHPSVRRRGYAAFVTARVALAILERGETPFLHVAESNDSARAVYEGLGFTTRRMVGYTAFRVPG